jgi:hypothetical protein
MRILILLLQMRISYNKILKYKLKTNNAFSDEKIINGFMKSSCDHFIDRSEQAFIIWYLMPG